MHPGRVDVSRPAPFRIRGSLAAPCVLASLLLSACATDLPPDPALAAVWRDYQSLPGRRALAIAGELRRNQWVAGASGGHRLSADAGAAAIEECQKRRSKQRMQAPCRLYAVGDELLWDDDR